MPTEQLPETLPIEKVQELLAKKHEDEAREMLVQHHLRLMMHTVNKLVPDHSDKESLYTIGTIGLIRGVDGYQLDSETPFSNHLVMTIQRELKSFIKGS